MADEVETQDNLPIDVPVFGEGSEETTEIVTESNVELDEFVSGAVDDEKAMAEEIEEAVEEKIEKISETAAKQMVIEGVNGVLQVASMLFSSDIKVSSAEIKCLADDLSPAVVKYANEIDELPPWLKGLMKYRVELIALKGVVLFGISIYMRVKEDKRKQALEEKRERERIKAQGAEHGS